MEIVAAQQTQNACARSGVARINPKREWTDCKLDATFLFVTSQQPSLLCLGLWRTVHGLVLPRGETDLILPVAGVADVECQCFSQLGERTDP
jgi:hypothetical protein